MNLKKMQIAYLLLAGVVLSGACSKRPEKVVSDSKMVEVMTDMEIAQAYLQSKGYQQNNPENRERILQYVLDKNKMNREEFDSTLAWYGRHIDLYEDLYAKVDKNLAKREADVSGNNMEALSNDLWPYSRHLGISSLSSADNFSFNIPAEDIEKGSKLTWKFHVTPSSDGTALLGVRYKSGGYGYISRILTGKENELQLQCDSAEIVKEIFGNIHLNNNNGWVNIDSLSLSSLPFDSTIYYQIHSTRKYRGPIRKKTATQEEQKRDTMEKKEEIQKVSAGSTDGSLPSKNKGRKPEKMRILNGKGEPI